jgi:hypothetical protein
MAVSVEFDLGDATYGLSGILAGDVAEKDRPGFRGEPQGWSVRLGGIPNADMCCR